MKRFLQIIFLFAVNYFSVPVFAQVKTEIFVAPSGNDNNDGTRNNPKATLQSAVRAVRDMRRVSPAVNKAPVYISLQKGVYQISKPVIFRPEDAGTVKSPTIIQGVEYGGVTLSGGVPITGWKKVSAVNQLPAISKEHVWEAPLPEVFWNRPAFRQMWVNEKKATRARWPNGNTMRRIISWNKKEETCQIPAPPFNFKSISGLEFFIHQWWEIAILRVKEYTLNGDSVRLSFKQPESRIQSEHPWPAPWISKETGNSAFYLSNAIELLDAPGEWFADVANKKVYYWPKDGERLSEATIIAPMAENIITIKGNADAPVTHLHFKNIGFKYVAWDKASYEGLVPHQTGMPMTEAYKLRPAGTKEKATLENQAWISRPAAAVSASFANHILFESCAFEHLAATALDFNEGVRVSNINGNLFNDIGGTAIMTGVFSDEATEIHLPYNPRDERVVTDSVTIENNFINDATNEDWGAVGIGIGYTRNSNIRNNEIQNVNYSGISMGWGWSPASNVMKNNRVTANKIHHYGKQNYDCAGIYTLSAQPGSVISENVVDSIYKAPYAHLPTHWFYLYTDEGSSYITIKDNWTPTQKYLQNNNGPGNVWQNNGPQVNSNIRYSAGLQAPYQYLKNTVTDDLNALPINQQHYELVELVLPNGKIMDVDSLRRVMIKSNMDPQHIYQWKNHYVIIGMIQDVTVMLGRLKKSFPDANVRPYHDMYYQFDRSKCRDTVNAKEWDHYILTANLVQDKSKQEQYLTDHATQFEKWPEVAKGFCNAQFQQLLCFRNGRQLMLVISVPKGKTLDELDPKTTENNPRVVEWNKRMAKYQEGIAGTKKGEVWVFLEKSKK